ncbi:hypothetical protein JCM10296v2_000773 [Rhodotorula toruloides]
MHGLHLPRPARCDSLPPVPSSSSSAPPNPHQPLQTSGPSTRRIPPRNFSELRAQARIVRSERKSPFLRKSTAGKERDLRELSVEQLSAMFERNARLLDSPDTFADLPGGDSRLRNQQERIRSRLHDLQSMSQIKQELASTHLESEEERKVKKEEEERDGRGEMEGVVEDGAAEEATSASVKRRVAAQVLSNSPNSLSLEESLALQRQAAERARKAAQRREQKMELDAKRPEKTGELLKGALGVDSAVSNYMFHADSDDSLDEDDIDDWLNEGRRGANGELNDEEDAQLNPLRTAYMDGWNRAAKEG